MRPLSTFFSSDLRNSDYRGLKKHISAIKNDQEAIPHEVDDGDSDRDGAHQSTSVVQYGSMGHTPPFSTHAATSYNVDRKWSCALYPFTRCRIRSTCGGCSCFRP